MALFGIRYDLRCPAFGKADSAALAAAAIEQCAWADERGFLSVTLSEHHGSPDSYLPSPMVLGAAIAARTKNLRISLAAMIAPLHHPVRLAEDLAVLDVVSNGRLIPIVSGGYVESEFTTFGRKLSERAKLMDEIVPFLERAWTGEPFEWEGRTVRVTPRPVQQPRPPILMGGASKAAARRAARFADDFLPSLPEFYESFREERKKLGKPVPPAREASPYTNFLHVAEDPDEAWAKIAPHAMHEMNAYGRWAAASGTSTGYRPIEEPEELRKTGQYPVRTPDALVAELKTRPATMVMLHPLMGGLHPDVAWESLDLIGSKVIPALQAG